jgi:hypothetical protein
MSVLSKYKLNNDLYGAIVSEPETLQRASTSTVLKLNQTVPHIGSIQGERIDSLITLKEAKLTYVSLVKQTQYSTGREYWITTGMMKPVRMDIELMIDGTRINLIDALHQHSCEISGIQITRDEFLMNMANMGLDLVGGQSLFFQQFGADKDKFDAFVDVFKANGAHQTINEESGKGNIKQAYRYDDGLAVTQFEVGTTDRTESARYKANNVGQGFLNFIDAIFDQFERIAGYRKAAAVKNALAAAPGVSEVEIAKLREQASRDMKLAGMSTSNWAGAQRRYARNGGTFDKQDFYDLVNLPCGRLTVVTKDGPYQADFWSNKRSKVSLDDTVNSPL